MSPHPSRANAAAGTAFRWVIAWGVWLIWIGLSDALDAPWSAFYLLGLLLAFGVVSWRRSR